MYNPRGGYSSPTTLGISERWERVLCYVFGWISGLIFLLIEQRNQTVRRHAMQSIFVFGGLSLLGWVLSIFGSLLSNVGIIGPLFGAGFGLLHWILGLVGFALWIGLMIAAYLTPETFIPRNGRRFV